MNNKAYIVFKGEYSDREALAVFLTREGAEKALPAYVEYDEDGEPYPWRHPTIREIPLEPEFPVVPLGHKAYEVRISEQGKTYTAELDCPGEYLLPEGVIEVKHSHEGAYRCFVVHVVARDVEHACRIAYDRQAMFQARQAGIA